MTKITTIVFAAVLTFSPVFLCAQPGPPVDPDVPLTGVEWLLLGGGIMGGRKLYLNYKKGKQ